MKTIAFVDATSRTLPYNYFFIKAIAEHYKVDVYCSRPRAESVFFSSLSTLPNVRLIELNTNRANRAFGLLSIARMYCTLLWRRSSYTAIHIQWSVVPLLEYVFWRLLRNKIVYTIHNHSPHGSASETYRPFLRLASIARAVVFVSPSTCAKFVNEQDQRLASKSHTLAIGAMPAIIEPAHPQKIFRGELKTLIFFGSVKQYKGLDFLPACMPAIIKRGIALEVYGSFGAKHSELCKELRDSGASVTDKYMHDQELHELLTASGSAIVLPYSRATQSAVLYTALHYQIPILASDSGDNGAFLRNENMAELSFAYGDVASFSRSLDCLIDTYSIVEKHMLEAAAKYNWRYPIEQLRTIYEA
jgi:glycosyltransferase involved in cell wall biosynthesis